MDIPQNINNAILKQSNEHKIILDYVSRFDTAIMNKKNDELLALIRHLAPFLQKDLISHFEMEERFFFPAILHTLPSEENIKTVLRLQYEHGILTRDLHWMTQAIERAKFQQADIDQELLRYLRPFLHALKIHARIEIVELFPLIDRSEACTDWITRQIATG